MVGNKIPWSSLVLHLKARHVQFNRKSDIFALLSGLSRVARFLTKGQNGTKTLDATVGGYQLWPIAGFHCHAIKKYIQKHSMRKANKFKCYKIFINEQHL